MTLLLGIVSVALTLSTLHLGRPAFAWRALKMWKRSWLSREVLLFSLFAGALGAATSVHWLLALDTFSLPVKHLVYLYLPQLPPAFVLLLKTLLPVLDWTALALAILGTIASSFIYLIKARPAWNTVHTPLDFLLTGVLGGSVLFRLAGGLLSPAPQFLPISGIVIQAAAILWIGNFAVRILRMKQSDTFELQATATLLSGPLRKEFFVGACALLAGLFFSFSGMVPVACGVLLFDALVLRYLFFVSVVPLNMALTFLNQESAH